jgi:hypothetical protein
LSWFDAVSLALDFAATTRAMSKGKGRADQLLAEIEAHTLEEFARILEKRAQTDTTPPHGTVIPAEAVASVEEAPKE